MNKQKGGLLSISLIALSMILFLGSVFAFFLPLASRPNGDTTANVFSYMFGLLIPAEGSYKIPALTAIFVLQMINTAVIIFLIYTIISKQHSNVLAVVLMSVVCLLSLISLIISFNALDIYSKVHDIFEYKLGLGPILYSVLNIVGIVSCLAGIVLSKKGL